MVKKRERLLRPLLLALLAVLVLTGAAAQRAVYDGERIYDNSSGAVCYVRSLTEAGALKTAGSCFIISADGIALTASHVVRDAASVHVVLPSGEELSGVTVLEADAMTDVAVLRLPARKEAYPSVPLDTLDPRSGERVYAIGYPLKTVKIISDGIVSNPAAKINGLERLLVSADLASGMSGGPILSEHGAVVGMASATLRTMNGVSTSPTTAQLRSAAGEFTTGAR